VMGLTLALQRAGHRAELVCDPDGALWERAREAGVVCRPLSVRNSIDIAAGLRLRALLTRQNYDVVHFHTARAHALAPFARGPARALVVTRRMDFRPNRLFAPWLYNRAVDGVAAISAGVADALARGGVARERIVIIPSGVDCAHFAPPDASVRAQARAHLDLRGDDLAIGTVGALSERKGHHVLLEAMALALGEADKAVEARQLRALIAGAGPLEPALAAEIRRRGLESRVRMLGHVGDIRTLLWALDIFVMPSLKEGLGIAVLEAMACGLPLIASAVGGMPEAVDDGLTGMLVRPGNARILAEAITQLGAAPERREAMGVAGRARAVARFGIEVMARQTLELYQRCLASSARAQSAHSK
jgi:glycosyltransferase involved in cell wall biosynthesis